MPNTVYSLDSSIQRFFSESGVVSSKAQCDEFTLRMYGGSIQPVQLQGSCSYTVIAGIEEDKIVQFREQTALLDTSLSNLIKDIHGDIVPTFSEVGRIGDLKETQLVIYEMERLAGDNFILTRSSLTQNQLLNTVNSLASFFAKSWNRGAMVDSFVDKSVDKSAISLECNKRIQYLADSLPARFQPIVAKVQATLPALLDGCYPIVPTHGDLNEMNILVDPHSGHITGVVDWADASFLPFGFTLYALENSLGSMGSSGWNWFDNASGLRDAFWKAFQHETGLAASQTKLVKLAGIAGILIRYGTPYDSGFSGMIGVRDAEGEDFRYLDALLLSKAGLASD